MLLLLLKSVGIDDDIALLRVVRASHCVGLSLKSQTENGNKKENYLENTIKTKIIFGK